MPRPAPCRSSGRLRRGAVAAAAATCMQLALPTDVHADDPPTPRDPNDTPPMRAPYGQPNEAHTRVRTDISHARRFVLTVLPVYASFNLDFLGREREPLRGGGAALEADLQVLRFLWLRVSGSHTVHPVDEGRSENRDGVTILVANAGLINATDVALSVVYAMDFGRIIPLIDAGVGGMFIATPSAVQDGQLGASCRAKGECDIGLRCGGDNVCRVGVVGEAHAGLGIDVPIRDHISLGAHFRYHALLTDITTFPVYLQAAARFSVRF